MHGAVNERHPNHKVEMSLVREHIKLYLEGDKIADTIHALSVEETGNAPVIYIPKSDLKDVVLIATDRSHDCPHKGHARFFNVQHGSVKLDCAAWIYDEPREEVTELKDYVAFAPEKFEFIRVQD
jgi:uncharacterized protein (DUF427 family)